MGLYSFKGAIDSDRTWQDFGRELMVSEDLDPVYVMLAEAALDDNLLKRWLLAYFCYYNVGVASKVAEVGSDKFYNVMWQGVEERWPRGMERRYFWGDMATNTIAYLESVGSPEAIIDNIAAGQTFDEVSARTQALKGFGPWMGWKVADVIERVMYVPVDFSKSTLGIYKDPVQGAAMVVYGDWRHPITENELDVVVAEQIAEFSDLLAPPFYDRPANIQEVETNLCKFKAHYKNAYPLGNDTYHIRKALVGWGDLAQELLGWCPEIKPGHKGYVEAQ